MSGLNAREFLDEVIRPAVSVLARAEPRVAADAAFPLLLGTALHESAGLSRLRQIRGPARSLFQIEPATFLDVYEWASHRGAMFDALRSLQLGGISPLDQYAGNQHLSCAVARLLYWRRPEPLPAANDAAGLAAYHKQWFNTLRGAADPEKTVVEFRQAISICGKAES